jgi:hypothetical protein
VLHYRYLFLKWISLKIQKCHLLYFKISVFVTRVLLYYYLFQIKLKIENATFYVKNFFLKNYFFETEIILNFNSVS